MFFKRWVRERFWLGWGIGGGRGLEGVFFVGGVGGRAVFKGMEVVG